MHEILRHLANQEQPFAEAIIQVGKPMRLFHPDGWRVVEEFGKVTEAMFTGLLHVFESDVKNALKNGKTISHTLDLEDLAIGNLRIRCTIYTIEAGRRLAASLRPIQRVPMTLHDLGAPHHITSFSKAPKGLLLVTGPTSSGKTTLIMSLLTQILSTTAVHVVTIEDPIEFLLSDGKGIVSQREVGRDVASYAEGLSQAFRQKPNIIFIGEIRDEETALTAIRAAESGHFVVATTHARSAVAALQKISSLAKMDESALGYCLAGAVAQVLTPSTDGSRFVLATELINGRDEEVQKKIIEGKWSDLAGVVKRGGGGCYSLNSTLAEQVRSKTITEGAAKRAAYDPSDLIKILG